MMIPHDLFIRDDYGTISLLHFVQRFNQSLLIMLVADQQIIPSSHANPICKVVFIRNNDVSLLIH